MGICEGDDPAEKARSFAVAFQLKEDMEEGLRNILHNHLEEHLLKNS